MAGLKGRMSPFEMGGRAVGQAGVAPAGRISKQLEIHFL